MDQFEAARLKHAKNLERKLRTASQEEPQPVTGGAGESPRGIQSEPAATPEKKPSADAVIEVTITLPDRVIAFTFRKRGVYANAIASKLTKQGFANAIAQGLVPLLGRVE